MRLIDAKCFGARRTRILKLILLWRVPENSIKMLIFVLQSIFRVNCNSVLPFTIFTLDVYFDLR